MVLANLSNTLSNPIATAAWFTDDVWIIEKIGLKPMHASGIYYLNFKRMIITWFKEAVKRFVLFQSTTKSCASCRSYVVNLNHFAEFLAACYPNLASNAVNRLIIVDYIRYLTTRNLSSATRHIALIHLRTFHTIAVQEKWLPWPLEPLIYHSDLPKLPCHSPRFIPESVIHQLKVHLPNLPEHLQRLIIVLLETGRRVGEVCSLAFNCLDRDEEGGVFLRVQDSKLKKSYLIPISPDCVTAITQQQAWVLKNDRAKQKFRVGYLFPSKQATRNPHLNANYVNNALNKLAEEYRILDDNGVLWHFHAHQFRHTVGTRMINAGVSQAVVQRYLGHESPEMTARYAYIHQDTLKKSFQQFQAALIDVKGYTRPIALEHQDAMLLKQNIMAQALPNGFCGLPLIQQACPHANACLTCTHFRTHKEFLPQHEAQLKETNRLIETAKANQWQRQVEMNNTVKKNLETIIHRLKEEPNYES